jgi:hypothetical protein
MRSLKMKLSAASFLREVVPDAAQDQESGEPPDRDADLPLAESQSVA